MKIASSDIAMTATDKKSETYAKTERLQIAKGNSVLTVEKNEGYIKDEVNLSENVRTFNDENATQGVFSNPVRLTGDSYECGELPRNPKLEMLTKMIEMLMGKKLKFVTPSTEYSQKLARAEAFRMENLRISLQEAMSNGNGLQTSAGTGITGISYEKTEVYTEKQQMKFEATGTVKTEDGREINFNTSISMSREFAQASDISFRAGTIQTCDPLVINYKGGGANLTSAKFSFDLDCDGTRDKISFTAPGSGFLALDLNEDGKINDGNELFGTKSGNGFKDLAKYDNDNNGWIDENDAIYDKLRIWEKDENGTDRLIALGVAGVGAIYLGNTESNFTIKDSNNETLGEVRRTGIFLHENGNVGTIKHIDLAL
ncbi:MAG: hypothetical protein IJR47_01160 [Clostridia bacterium]|nr:hypothetical protein [Clostridia bacterium]